MKKNKVKVLKGNKKFVDNNTNDNFETDSDEDGKTMKEVNDDYYTNYEYIGGDMSLSDSAFEAMGELEFVKKIID
jgi:hypothetical protein